MIAHAFIATAHDEWIMRYHLRAYLSFCERACCVLDRAPNLEPICREFGVEFVHWNTNYKTQCNFSGWIHDEGLTRQMAWDMAAKHSPDWIALGDPDETPTPDVLDFVKELNPDVDLYLCNWCNLIGSLSRGICGDNRWSWQSSKGNKKGFIARRRDGIIYRYAPVVQHSRMEPNGIRGRFDDRHVLIDHPILMHYKLAAWNRWIDCPQRINGNQWIEAESMPRMDIPESWHWPDIPQ